MAISRSLLLFLSLFFLPNLHAIHYRDCGDASSPIQVGSVEILNDKGRSSFKISGSTNKNIRGGHVVMEVKLGIIRYLKRTYELCEIIACPIAPGSFVLPFDNILPWLSFPKFSVHIDMTEESDDEEQIMCLDFETGQSVAAVISA